MGDWWAATVGLLQAEALFEQAEAMREQAKALEEQAEAIKYFNDFLRNRSIDVNVRNR